VTVLYLLHNLWRDWLSAHQAYGYFRVFQYVTFRAIFAALTAFVLAAYLGPTFIRLLSSRRVRTFNHTTDTEDIVESRRGKEKTPTMGGLLILLAILAAVLMWADLWSYHVRLGLLVVVWLGAVGFADDWRKLTRPESNGLKMRTKFLFQIGLGLLVGYFLWRYQGRVGGDGTKLVLPFYHHLIQMSLPAFVMLAMLVIVATSNAVNLTDGLDGLAVGCTVVAGLAFTGLTYVAGHRVFAEYLRVPYVAGVEELTILAAALVGAGLGFLWWNCHPAEVFMGDTGSLALGGIIGYLAVAARSEVLLLIVGGVFVIEAGSVVLQVASYRLRGGKRVFLRAPYHHHLQKKGLHENQITVRFWILASLFAAVAVATLKLR
jgi:phospho-N-acetylmuramoyl-pentapeptide-transferase